MERSALPSGVVRARNRTHQLARASVQRHLDVANPSVTALPRHHALAEQQRVTSYKPLASV